MQSVVVENILMNILQLIFELYPAQLGVVMKHYVIDHMQSQANHTAAQHNTFSGHLLAASRGITLAISMTLHYKCIV